MGGSFLQKRRLGQTDIEVSVLGLGTVKFGRNQQVKYPQAFQLPNLKEAQTLLDCAASLGINFLDTAPAYGNSEELLGTLLKTKRHDWIVMTKAGEEFVDGQSIFNFSSDQLTASVERSLKRLQTDYLDIVLIHSDGNDVELIEKECVFKTLDSLKQSGKIRAYGMSSKTIQGGLLAVEHADVAMITFNSIYADERPVIEAAHDLQKGILIKKAFASGHLNKFPIKNGRTAIDENLHYILREPGVTSVIVGTLNPDHLCENAKCVKSSFR